jgi:hypothetical protein
MANIDQLRTFLGIFNNKNLTPAQTVTQLMPLFSPDITTAGKIVSPGVGITDHGPGFFGKSDIGTFFLQLFTTFHDMQWTWPPAAIPAAPMLSDGANTFGFQMDVTGTFEKPWFSHASGFASQPLSQLGTGTHQHLGKKRGNAGGVPACAVFTFDGTAQFLIKQIAIYMDRYAMMQSITNAGGWTPDAAAFDIVQSIGHAGQVVVGEPGRRITITIEY